MNNHGTASFDEEFKVSIGIPVFNGAKTLAKTIEAVINQDYTNLEIIISDNCSTDETQSIAEEYQKKDSRIKYIRQDKNYGMTSNFSKVFGYTTGDFFMWAAHDDQHDTTFISKCLPLLLSDPEAGLCVPRTQGYFRGEVAWVSSMKSFTNIESRSELYNETLRHFPACGMYGLYRSSKVAKTQLWRNFTGADLVFVQDLTLHGNIVICEDILFSYFEREKWNTLEQDYANIHATSKIPWYYSPFLIVFGKQMNTILHSQNSLILKIKLLRVLLRFQIGQAGIKVSLKLLKILSPVKFKQKLAVQFYWKFIHNPNIEVENMSAFLERNILPMLGMRSAKVERNL
jgi:glycosyltransferase involved in cell wall biosynthesis